jgi:predicted ArsR family transcriptional regulator
MTPNPTFRPTVQASQSQDHIGRAIALLRELGGFCEEQEEDGKIVLQCFECPFAEVDVGHPEVCLVVETVLTDILGVPAHQRCGQDPSPRCRFEIETGAADQ